MEHQAETPPFVLYHGAPFAHLGQCQCDCACAPGLEPAPGQASTPAVAVCVRQPGVVNWPLDKGWQAAYNPAGPVGVAALSPAAQRVLAAFDRPASVDEASRHVGSLVPAFVRRAAESLLSTGLLRPVAEEAPATRPST
ncbi:MAG TPA: hypothetical protein VLC95_05330, partial [Anaerolineae bacterium]|nr:hypothetical protein [Anaerolineae bacterium]